MAVSDETRTIAYPLRTFVRRTGGLREAIKAVKDAIAETGAVEVVVGYPLTFDGEIGTQAQKAAAFAEALRTALQVPVVLHDERLSSFEAEQAMDEAGIRKADRQGRLDAVAASVILRSYLDALESEGPLQERQGAPLRTNVPRCPADGREVSV